jgi:hypothetical protein
MKSIVALIILIILVMPNLAWARTTPNDLYQEKRAGFENTLSRFQDPAKKSQVLKLDQQLKETNLKIAVRFEEETLKLGAVMEEYKRRQGIKETRVAYGNVDSAIEQADYWVNYAAEAVAYQKIADYTPYGVSENNISASANSAINTIRLDYSVLRGKIMRAKSEVAKLVK